MGKGLTSNVGRIYSDDLLPNLGDTVVVSGVDSTFNGTWTVTGLGAGSIPGNGIHLYFTFTFALVAANVATVSSSGTVVDTTFNQSQDLTQWMDENDVVQSKVDAAGALTATALSIIVPGTTGNTYKFAAAASPPSNTTTIQGWVLVTVNGTDYKMPLYL